MPASQKPKTSYYYKLFRVKRNDGRVTTVSLCPLLVTRACKEIQGGLKEVGSLVRKSAFAFEEGMAKSCSGYVRDELKREVEAALRRRKMAAQQAQVQPAVQPPMVAQPRVTAQSKEMTSSMLLAA